MAKDSGELLSTSPEFLGAAWFDPIEAVIRDRVRGFIENLVEAELDDALGRSRYQRAGAADVASGTAGYRHGRRARQLLGSFLDSHLQLFCHRSRSWLPETMGEALWPVGSQEYWQVP